MISRLNYKLNFVTKYTFGEGRKNGHRWGVSVSSIVEFYRWWVLKSKIFAQESTYSKDFFLNLLMNYSLSKRAKIVLSESIFNVKNQPNFFSSDKKCGQWPAINKN